LVNTDVFGQSAEVRVNEVLLYYHAALCAMFALVIPFVHLMGTVKMAKLIIKHSLVWKLHHFDLLAASKI